MAEPEKTQPNVAIPVHKERGSSQIMPHADLAGASEIADRLRGSICSAITKNIASGDLLAGVFIFVTPQGTVHWELQEVGATGDSGGEKEMQLASTRLAMAFATGAVNEKMRSGIRNNG